MNNSPILHRPEQTRVSLAQILAPIFKDLEQAEWIFDEELRSRFPSVRQLVDHCAGYHGKRLRPALLLLTARASGTFQHAHLVLAAVVEMIHAATLVHDDILDNAVIRRHAATVNAEWGNKPAVLLGDYLFTHAFHLAASLESTLACRWIGRATNLVCEGEVEQNANSGNLDLEEASYFEIIKNKTAELTAVSCRLGAHYAGASPEVVEKMEQFGRDLGVAFQIADDLLDLRGDERVTGKSLGTDLAQLKLTLPLIRMLSTSSPEMVARARALLAGPRPDRAEVRMLLEASGAIDYTWQMALDLTESAETALESLPHSSYRESLRCLVREVVPRQF